MSHIVNGLRTSLFIVELLESEMDGRPVQSSKDLKSFDPHNYDLPAQAVETSRLVSRSCVLPVRTAVSKALLSPPPFEPLYVHVCVCLCVQNPEPINRFNGHLWFIPLTASHKAR